MALPLLCRCGMQLQTVLPALLSYSKEVTSQAISDRFVALEASMTRLREFPTRMVDGGEVAEVDSELVSWFQHEQKPHMWGILIKFSLPDDACSKDAPKRPFDLVFDIRHPRRSGPLQPHPHSQPDTQPNPTPCFAHMKRCLAKARTKWTTSDHVDPQPAHPCCEHYHRVHIKSMKADGTAATQAWLARYKSDQAYGILNKGPLLFSCPFPFTMYVVPSGAEGQCSDGNAHCVFVGSGVENKEEDSIAPDSPLPSSEHAIVENGIGAQQSPLLSSMCSPLFSSSITSLSQLSPLILPSSSRVTELPPLNLLLSNNSAAARALVNALKPLLSAAELSVDLQQAALRQAEEMLRQVRAALQDAEQRLAAASQSHDNSYFDDGAL
jgi:hypothetical protein